MDPLLQFSPDELEQQRLRANQLRGQGMVGALSSTSQIPGAASQGQLMQRMAQAEIGRDQSANADELKRRGTEKERGLARAAQREALDYQKEQDRIANARAKAEAERRRTASLSAGETLVDEVTGEVIAKGGAKPKTATEKKAAADSTAESASRIQNIDRAAKFLTAFESGAESGATRSALKMLPGVFTDQASFDEELDSFAEEAARARLKALGEIRPTDADVKGMKEALFGVGRDEQTNKNLLQQYIQGQVEQENVARAARGEEPMEMPGPVDVGRNWYETLFESNDPAVVAKAKRAAELEAKAKR